MCMDRNKRKITAAVWSLAVILLVLIYMVYVLMFMSKGWFSNKSLVRGKEDSVAVAEAASIIVRKESGGDDIDTIRADNPTDASADDLLIEFEGQSYSTQKLSPGSSGSFTVYIVKNENKLDSSYDLVFNLYSEGTINANEEPYRSMTPTQIESARTTALKYVNKHIAFFYSYDPVSDTYSDYIPSNTDYSRTFHETEPNTEQEVTIYWLWIENYVDITTGRDGDNGPHIEGTCRTQMRNDIASGSDGWFYGGNTNLSDAYNNADMLFASTLWTINFEMLIKTG